MSIILRPLEDAGIPALFELLQHYDLYRYLTFPPPRSMEELALRLEVDVRSGGQVFTVHREDAPERPVGFCRYRVEGAGRCNVGYTIGRDFWRQGYATRVVAALIEELICRRGVVEVVAEANIDNVASIRALEKNGFLYSGATATTLKFEPSYELEYSLRLEGAAQSDAAGPL
ncbi:GNAT family N-acetyltransferase [Roseateles sp. L2-2]|uniref:GNAT family N-acetyltransferase n=1 Tax=Roseateles sp. L2-2 TaxID=3422597 RepID=UPI003D35CAA5